MMLNEASMTTIRQLMKSQKYSSDPFEDCMRAAVVGSPINALLAVCDESYGEIVRAPAVEACGGECSLLGMVYVLKDNIDVKGMASTCGSKLLSENVAREDSEVYKLLRNSGAILLGKANMDAFAMGSGGETSDFGYTVNPLDHSLVAGGSSSGSAAAVAANMAHFAIGTDTSGSVRVPAAYCGVCGFKPTYGIVPDDGVMPCAKSLDCVGTLTRSAYECAMVMDIIAVGSLDRSGSRMRFEASCDGEMDGLRIGVPVEYLQYAGLNPSIKKDFEDAMLRMKKLGASIKKINIKHFNTALDAYRKVMSVEVGESIENLIGNKKAGEEAEKRRALGKYLISGDGAMEYVAAKNIAQEIKLEYVKTFEDIDIIATPTAPTIAFKPGGARGDEDIFTVGASLAGVCAITVPYSQDGAKLPSGIQLIGAAGNDVLTVKIADAFERSNR